jgi:hypothetical protein
LGLSGDSVRKNIKSSAGMVFFVIVDIPGLLSIQERILRRTDSAGLYQAAKYFGQSVRCSGYVRLDSDQFVAAP